jgi:hypothetical protein
MLGILATAVVVIVLATRLWHDIADTKDTNLVSSVLRQVGAEHTPDPEYVDYLENLKVVEEAARVRRYAHAKQRAAEAAASASIYEGYTDDFVSAPIEVDAEVVV